ncbi:hypothetical protein HALLA_03310 (plasmid) [Halostagnicola larsenii XH-48]|uniref:Uncharacterized protein n=1 Tax=Halostagnicola larsenii XH-48 TaxID=797299 RepID=W0JS47_9EURY|nr:hypothetical protein HALLA_03310 [Halostagnicola larsenii XH-48]
MVDSSGTVVNADNVRRESAVLERWWTVTAPKNGLERPLGRAAPDSSVSCIGEITTIRAASDSLDSVIRSAAADLR